MVLAVPMVARRAAHRTMAALLELVARMVVQLVHHTAVQRVAHPIMAAQRALSMVVRPVAPMGVRRVQPQTKADRLVAPTAMATPAVARPTTQAKNTPTLSHAAPPRTPLSGPVDTLSIRGAYLVRSNSLRGPISTRSSGEFPLMMSRMPPPSTTHSGYLCCLL